MERLNLPDFKESQHNLATWRGSRNNRAYWNMMLALASPKVIEEVNGTATVIEFLGNKYHIVGVPQEGYSEQSK